MVQQTKVQSQVELYQTLKNGTWCLINVKVEKAKEWRSVLTYTSV